MTKHHRQRGMITVFVTLMMVPVVVITGLMVDVSRLKLYSSQAVMAADSYGEAILSEYDNLLKELYGLFSVTQNEEGMAALETMKKYTEYSFHPNGDGKGLNGFMPYKSADVDIVYEPIDGATLNNSNVLMTQISDFMKYRIVEEVLDDGGSVLKTLKRFDKMDADMTVMKDRKDLTDSSQKVLEEISNYFEILEKINDYPGFIKEEEKRYKAYSEKLTEISTGSDYEDYVFYLEHKQECEEAIEKKDRIDKENAGKKPEEQEKLSEWEEHLIDIANRVSDYDRQIADMVNLLKEKARDYTGTGKKTDYEAVPDQISDLEKSAKKIDESIRTLDNQVNQLKGELGGCSEQIRDGIREEIQGLEEILALKDDFLETYNLIEPIHKDSEQSRNNKKEMDEKLDSLDTVLENLKTGNIEPGASYWAATISFDWYSFREDKDQFYKELERICGSEGTGGDKDAGKKKQEEADKAREEAENALKQEDETTDARDIPASIAAQLQISGSSGGAVPDLLSYFSGGLSFHAIGNVGSHLIDKFLVTSYDFGMFSSRVSGKEPEDEKELSELKDVDADNSTYYDVSLTGYKMSKNINYLYGAELEYLLGGRSSSRENLNETRNIICGVRMTMNFVSTYSIDEINKAIKAIADTAANAVAASGVGAAVAPLVRVAVSGALRAAVATIETYADWTALKNREKVTFLKKEIDQLESFDQIAGLLGGEVNRNQSDLDKGPQLDYEDYLYVLICLMLDTDTLMSRTANLITLNVNQAQNTGDTLSSLKFKMADTVTAVKSTCKVKMDFVVVPDNFIELYLSGTATESMIEVLEDRYLGYSIIRGY